MQYIIQPVFNGMFTFSTVERPLLPEIRNIPVFCFLIRAGDGSCILVDSGLSPAYVPSMEGSVEQDAGQRLDRALLVLGVAPEQVRTVIQTHLHWDHTASLAMFPRAEIIVQAAELQSLFRLKPYEDTYYYYDAWYDEMSRLRIINGNMNLMPGLDIVFTAGHTAGHQIVRVRSGAGEVVLAGDLSSNYDDLWWMIPEEFWQRLKSERPPRYDWNGEFLPAVRRLLQGQRLWDAPPCKPLEWREVRRSGNRILLSHDPRLYAEHAASGRNAAI